MEGRAVSRSIGMTGDLKRGVSVCERDSDSSARRSSIESEATPSVRSLFPASWERRSVPFGIPLGEISKSSSTEG